MAMKVEIVLADRNAEALKKAAIDLGVDPEGFVLCCLLSAIGVWPMEFFAKVKEALTALRSAPKDIRDQLLEVLALGLESKITGRDFETCLGELTELDGDIAWTPET